MADKPTLYIDYQTGKIQGPFEVIGRLFATPKYCVPQLVTGFAVAGFQPAVGLAWYRNPDINCETEH